MISQNRVFSAGTRVAVAGLVLAWAAVLASTTDSTFAQGADPCAPPPAGNPVACENQQTGALPTEWDIQGAGDPTIQGFATDISVNRGQTISFKIDTDATAYRLDIYRMGYYSGRGARKVATVLPSASLPQSQPECLTDDATGLVDCGNWAVSASWAVPSTAVSGIYFAKVVRLNTGGASHIVFVVRDDSSQSTLLFQTADTTWQAYNQYGGNSLYVGGPGQSPGRAFKVSYNRPFTTRETAPEDWVFNAEYPMVRWLEANGYNVSYSTGVDSDRRGAEILEHRVFASIGHDEYWSAAQRTAVENARAAGVHLAFFSGNEVFWKTRWENSIAPGGASYRTLVSYKETHANAKIDPTSTWTGTWQDPRFSPPSDGGRPPNALTGTSFTVNCCTYSIEVPAAEGKMRFWRNTSIAALAGGQVASLPQGTLGYEWDSDLDNGFRPAGLMRLSNTTVLAPQVLQDHGSTYAEATARHALTLYRHSSGALVFGAGTVQWSWGLDASHDREPADVSLDMQQATVNLFADMDAQPVTIQPGLAAATKSIDTVAPSATVVAPAGGSAVAQNSTITVSGTATDGGGGVVAGVEVSFEGGPWWRADGGSNWSYSWSTGSPRTVTIRARAVDDTGNLGAASAPISVTVGTIAASCPCSIWSPLQSPVNVAEPDAAAAELGLKFRSTVDGYISGVRFFKSSQNTGTHIGNLWTSNGILLATGTFTSETATGWQQVNFPTPVEIAANTTYVVSYHTTTGFYSQDPNYFSAGGLTNGPLQALADGGASAANGVYHYGPSGFPSSSAQGSNYWVDVVFVINAGPDTTPPAIVARIPAPNATGVSATGPVAVRFNERLTPSTVNASTFTLRNAQGNVVASTLSYDVPTRTVTLTPSAALPFSASFTMTVLGGSTGVKDLAGNALASNSVWSFTTQSQPPPPPNTGPGGPILVVTSPGNPFSEDYAEILRTEGLNSFALQTLASVNASTLANYDVVILGEMALSTTQVTMFSDWVNAGGNLIAMRPDKKLAGLLGLTDVGTTLSEGYLLINTAAAPGAGLVNETIQYHGIADRYGLAGATSVATLYSTASAGTSNPAVTMRSVGSNGGSAAAFTYDLAKSVVYTRQGNPAWAGQERDGVAPIRSDDLFFGTSQPHWVDFNKIAIPQADEQQRLLTKLVKLLNEDRKPLPQFWYFPRGLKAVVVMTGDDHATNGTTPMFDGFIERSTPGCSVVDWECVRATSYVYPTTPIGDSQVAAYIAQGFEIGVHITTGCSDYTPESVDGNYAGDLAAFGASFPSVQSVVTNRTHCIVWSDYSSQAEVAKARGIRLDTNYYYFPGSWVNDRPGVFTGSGMPMRFAKTDGTMIDVYQAATQMTDESGQTYPLHADTLLDRALGPLGFYGAFVTNMHTDYQDHPDANAIIQSAQTRGVPVISARQLLDWTDGRNASSFGSLVWNGTSLNFTVSAFAGSNGLRTMLPVTVAGRTISTVTRNAAPLEFSIETIKGVAYAMFASSTGSYTANYTIDTTAPTISGVGASPTATSASITWTTNEGASSRVDYGTSPQTLNLTKASTTFSTSHLVALSGLTGNTTYYYRVTSADPGGNSTTSPAAPSAPLSFTTPPPPSLGCPCSIWSPSTVPATPSVADANAIEVGVRFRPTADGYITAIRFYKGAENTGTHVGHLWSSTGTLLATVTFSGETTTGWQEAVLSPGVQVTANTTYVVSYFTSSGFYSADVNYFQSGVTNGPLQALANSNGGNGVYRYGSSGFPASTWGATNYWVDVVFQAWLDATPPVITNVAATPAATTANVTWSTNEISTSRVDYGTSPTTLNANVSVSSAVAAHAVSLTGLSATTTYYYRVSSTDLSGNVSVSPAPPAAPLSFTTTAPPSLGCPCSIWSTTTVPATPMVADASAIELGVRFRASADGYITAIRFYKSSQNTGTHTGHLWTSTGTLLASVTFSGESGSGWQEAVFSTPVQVTANTTYVASYHTPTGFYAGDGGYFQAGVTNGPLQALPSSSGGNGVYRYGASGFPTNSWNSTNYWVDVVFQTALESVPPNISNVSATPSSTTATVTWTTNEIATSRVDYGTSPTTLDSTAMVSAAHTAHTVGLTGLNPETTYYYRVTSADLSGNTRVSPAPPAAPLSFTTTAAPSLGCPCSVWSSSTVPGTPSVADPSAVELGMRFQTTASGYIRAIRFYKGAQNNGTHTGNLWTNAGTLLGTVTFTNETASGWQEAVLTTPVAVAADTTYVVSYHTTSGNYAADGGYFQSAVTNGPLTALASSGGGNGLYRYGASGFPTGTWNSSNYWVDVVFATTP